MPDFPWLPIKPHSDAERSIDLASIRSLYESWEESRARFLQTSKERLSEFNHRLVRRLSIETGILEHLYELDRGTTEALVAQGFSEELVSRSNTDIEPARLIDILRDQESAIQLVMDCIAKNRKLTKSVIHELHVILTNHQESTVAIDQFGTRREVTLQKGVFKQQPNNPRRPNGELHQYCPPVQVESEIDNLLSWLEEYAADDPIIVAAWFHHRFTQIHPYQDGNGRVGRALTTLILLRANLLPLVIDRDMRVEYINALETADQGDLATLASLFARLERQAILQALSVDAETSQETDSSAVIGSLADKLNRRREAQFTELRSVNKLALSLRSTAHSTLDATVKQLKNSLPPDTEIDWHLTDGGDDAGTGHSYRAEAIQTASATRIFANFAENHYFAKAAIRIAKDRLVFVTSFHHVGRELSGFMEALAFARLESAGNSEDQSPIAEPFFVCSTEPLVFTSKTRLADIQTAFTRWLDSAVAVALKEFADRL